MKRIKRAKRPQRFSVVAAVRGNARRQVGQPPPARALAPKTPERVAAKHKSTFGSVLAAVERESGPDRD